MLSINYIIYEVYDKLAEEMEMRKQNIVFGQQLELCAKQAVEREQVIHATREMRHNIKHRLIVLEEMIKQGRQDESIQYIDKMLESNKEYHYEVSRSGNIVVDSLINNNNSIAKKEGIDFQARVFVPVELPFESEDLCIILGNALENAVEATRKVTTGEKYIEVVAVYLKETLSIAIKNSYKGKVVRDPDGRLKTTKEDKVNHGIGVMSIERAANKYNGEMAVEDNNEVFILKILLYAQREKLHAKT
jgi:sensor histidine kinase regulating citrate/malate metabolism